MLIKAGPKARSHVISRASGLKVLTRGVARTNFRCIARQAMRVPRIKRHVFSILGKDLRKDIKKMSSLSTNSILQSSSVDVAESFVWESLHSENRENAPNLFEVLESCVNVKRRNRAGKRKKNHKPSNITMFGVCAAIILRHRNHKMNFLQKFVSLALHTGHCSKQVCTISQCVNYIFQCAVSGNIYCRFFRDCKNCCFVYRTSQPLPIWIR